MARMGKMRDAYRLSVGNSEGKWALRRKRRIWKDNIKIHMKEIWQGCMNCIDLPQDRGKWRNFVQKVMDSQVPQSAGSYFANSGSVPSRQKRALRHPVIWLGSSHYLRHFSGVVAKRVYYLVIYVSVCLSVWLSVCLSVRTYQLGFHCKDFHKIRYCWLFLPTSVKMF